MGSWNRGNFGPAVLIALIGTFIIAFAAKADEPAQPVQTPSTEVTLFQKATADLALAKERVAAAEELSTAADLNWTQSQYRGMHIYNPLSWFSVTPEEIEASKKNIAAAKQLVEAQKQLDAAQKNFDLLEEKNETELALAIKLDDPGLFSAQTWNDLVGATGSVVAWTKQFGGQPDKTYPSAKPVPSLPDAYVPPPGLPVIATSAQ